MIFPSNRVRIMVAIKPIDFRKVHDCLAALVTSVLRKDPFTGTIFVFRARKADRLKLLYWDGTGLVMAYKRLEEWISGGRRGDPQACRSSPGRRWQRWTPTGTCSTSSW